MSYFPATDAYELFRRGYDTLDIAKLLGCSEALIYNQLSRRRNRIYSSYLLPYAGKDPNERPMVQFVP